MEMMKGLVRVGGCFEAAVALVVMLVMKDRYVASGMGL